MHAALVEHVVTAGGQVAVVSGGEVLVFSEDGDLRLRLGTRDETPPTTRPVSARLARLREEILDDLDVPEEERDSADAGALVEEEAQPGLRLPPRSEVVVQHPVIATGADAIWIGVDDGLWRVDAAGTATRMGRLGHRFDRLAVGPSHLAATEGSRLWVSRDRGRSWTMRTDGPAAPITSIAVSECCLWLGTTSGLVRLPLDREAPPVTFAPPPSRRAPPRFAALLPRLVMTAGAHTAAGRRDLRAGLFADFALGETTPLPVPSRPPIRETPQPQTSERDAPCLGEARSSAVGLSLAEPERARSYVERAGRAAWLPELRFRMDRRLGRRESLDLPAGGGSSLPPLGLDTADDVRYEARATWDLSRLVFNPDEIAAQSQALRMADTRREVESLVNRLYFERRHLKMTTPAPPRIAEVEAELDALSGGAFARCTAR